MRSSAALLCGLVLTGPLHAQTRPRPPILEMTVAQAHRAMLARQLTARQLVQAYLDRIAAYDQHGPAINSLIVIHPRALAIADSLDAEFRRTGRLSGPLHGIPVIVKDNYDTADLPTTAGSASLAGSIPPDDAFQVRKIREAGAIVLAKSNMAEFAFTPFETVGSMLPGYTRNPYALDRVTAGSSGGTAAAVAANLGLLGLGTDTGNSIRGPASHTALVGIRSTMGLTSRDGIIPLYFDRDVGGPMTRTVEDAVRVLDIIAGYDPADSVTAPARERKATSYAAHLKHDGLQGKRIGVLRQISNTASTDSLVLIRFNQAIADLRRGGATVIDSVAIAELDTLRGALFCGRFKSDINYYLASLGPAAPVKSLDEILRSRRFHPSIELRLRDFQEFTSVDQDRACQQARVNVPLFQAGVRKVLLELRLDALVYPTWNNPPRRIGDLASPHGNNSARISPPTGFPAISVPMGFVQARVPATSPAAGNAGNALRPPNISTGFSSALPVGLQILGDAWSEPTLIEIAYSYEQLTKHRRPPALFPELRR
jgi:Asp-tRNA(Asn)/Glu-tRNA(Gln) amidotransferase A subunit family amidase